MGKFLCWIGLHDFEPLKWSFEEEKRYYQEHGHLRPTRVHCTRCQHNKEWRG